MDPSTQPYRRSWMPFRRTGPSRALGGMQTADGTRTAAIPRRRINMAPVQLNRWMNDPAPTAPPAPPRAPSRAPAPAPRPAPPSPARPRPDGAYPQAPMPGRATPRQEQRRTSSARTAQVRTAMPTRVSESVPALVRQGQARSGGATMSAPPPPPTIPLGRSRQSRSRLPDSRQPGSGQPGSVPPRPPRTGSRSSISFEPLALVAFFLLFVAPPAAFFMAIASVRRAAKIKVSPVLSWIAFLVTGIATLWTIGFISALVEFLS